MNLTDNRRHLELLRWHHAARVERWEKGEPEAHETRDGYQRSCLILAAIHAKQRVIGRGLR